MTAQAVCKSYIRNSPYMCKFFSPTVLLQLETMSCKSSFCEKILLFTGTRGAHLPRGKRGPTKNSSKAGINNSACAGTGFSMHLACRCCCLEYCTCCASCPPLIRTGLSNWMSALPGESDARLLLRKFYSASSRFCKRAILLS